MTDLFASPRFLRHVLLADAASCIVCGALQWVMPGTVTPLLGLPAQLVVFTGIFQLVYGVLVGWLATRDPLPRAPVWLVAIGNIGWGVACIGLLMSDAIQPTTLGKAYVVLQATAVLLLADLQLLGLWRGATRRAALA